MRSIVAALVPAWVGLAALAAASTASADDGPALTPPSVAGPAADQSAPGELPRTLDAAPMPGSGPLLVVPGMNPSRNGLRNRPTSSPGPVRPAPRVEDNGLPPLVGPNEMREAVLPRAAARPTDPLGNGSRPPVTLESIPARPDDVSKNGDVVHDVVRPRSPSDPRADAPLFRRPGGLFGRFRSHVPVDRDGDDHVRVEPRTDPAADAALKRRVEKQIRESVGGKLRTYEVRVVGREIFVLARPSRFWQKRSVRSALESLPALNGYKSRVEVID